MTGEAERSVCHSIVPEIPEEPKKGDVVSAFIRGVRVIGGKVFLALPHESLDQLERSLRGADAAPHERARIVAGLTTRGDVRRPES